MRESRNDSSSGIIIGLMYRAALITLALITILHLSATKYVHMHSYICNRHCAKRLNLSITRVAVIVLKLVAILYYQEEATISLNEISDLRQCVVIYLHDLVE